jgi:hypothetical protein
MQLTKVNLWNKWMRNGRRPARPPFRFTEVKPMRLKDEVTTARKLDSGLSLVLRIIIN